MESIDPIYLILGSYIIFTILKVLGVFSIPSIPQESLLFFGSLTCLVWLLSCSCQSHIAKLLKWSQWSGLWVRGMPSLDLLVWCRISERSGCRSLNCGDLDQGVWGQMFYPVWSVCHIYQLTYLYYYLSEFFLVVSVDIFLQGYWLVWGGKWQTLQTG